MGNERALLNFIRAAVKDGGSVTASFYEDNGGLLKVSIESASYMTLPMEDRELDIIKFNPAPGQNAEPITIIKEKEATAEEGEEE